MEGLLDLGGFNPKLTICLLGSIPNYAVFTLALAHWLIGLIIFPGSSLFTRLYTKLCCFLLLHWLIGSLGVFNHCVSSAVLRILSFLILGSKNQQCWGLFWHLKVG